MSKASSSSDASASYPPFALDRPRFDQSTYYGRWRQFVELVSPNALFLTQKQIQEAKTLINQFEKGEIKASQVSDAALWKAKRVCDAAVHPQTGETVPAIFRLAAFVPVNIPICAGMLLAPPTLVNTLFWQWVNQSYNAGFNYANRNASGEQDNSTVLKSYVAATVVSCASAVGLGRVVENARSLTPAMRNICRKTVPFVAVASAGVFNVVAMRFNECIEGIDVIDHEGSVRGRSVVAGRESLLQVALTRVAIPVPILLLPPYLFETIKRLNMMPQRKYPKLATELAVLTLCLAGALPAAIAIFPQKGTIDIKRLEQHFWEIKDRQEQPLRHVYYNKGI